MSLNTPAPRLQDTTKDSAEVVALYRQLLDRWNKRSAEPFAALFAEDGNSIGFDGSMTNGRSEIGAVLDKIFEDHVTPAYVGKIREVRFLNPETAIIRAIAGMIPRGGKELNPALHAVHSLIAAKFDGKWRIALFQTTPAQFHGRPELVQEMTAELSKLI